MNKISFNNIVTKKKLKMIWVSLEFTNELKEEGEAGVPERN